MKKIVISLIAIAAFSMVSCNKEPLAESVVSVKGTDIITACTEENLTKTYLSGNDAEGYDVVWFAGDKIKIGDSIFTLIAGEGTTRGTFQGTLPKDGTYTATYPETFKPNTWWPETFIYSENSISGAPMVAKLTISNGKIDGPLKFENYGGLMRLRLKGTATIRKISYGGWNQTCHLLCAGGVALDNTNGKVFYIPLPETDEGGSTTQWFIFQTIDGLSIPKYTKFGTTIHIEHSKITDVTISGINSSAPQGLLPGEFSIANGSTVHFSKGNLRYTVDSQKWSFFDRQYECGPSKYEDGHYNEISLFTWGYEAKNSKNPSGTAGLETVYKGNFDLQNDWGSQIGTLGTWRTLTADEWEYLFKTRTDADKKYGYARVCGVKGIIILPDEFEDPHTNGGNGSFKPQSSKPYWIDNVYNSGRDWEAMEYAGAVFLPVTGFRKGSEISFPGEFACYWSSTAKEKNASTRTSMAYALNFGSYTYPSDIVSSGISIKLEFERYLGCAVRLVSGTYKVTFDLNGKPGTAPQSIVNILNGSTINKPAAPAAYGYIFAGWYREPECKTPWNFTNDVVTGNTTLYAGWTSGLIPGKFSVSQSKQVYFSKGNLWADASGSNASNPVLHLEDRQFSFNKTYDTKHISHFTWNSTASGAVGSSGSTGNLFCDENHKVSIDGSPAMYYALSQAEWKYLFNTLGGGRSMTHYGKPTHSNYILYCGVRGLVIYPDDYNGDGLSSEEEYNEENFPGDCIFIPCAAWRDGSSIKLTDRWNGFYWSSSANSSQQPYHLEIASDDAHLSDSGNANNALAIRLVTNVE